MWKMLEVGLHVWLEVSTLVVFKITILQDKLVRLLSLLLLQHRVSHFYVFAVELVSRQELHNAGSDGVTQNIGCGTETVPVNQRQNRENVWCTGNSFYISGQANYLIYSCIGKIRSEKLKSHKFLTQVKKVWICFFPYITYTENQHSCCCPQLVACTMVKYLKSMTKTKSVKIYVIL